jgi:transposase
MPRKNSTKTPPDQIDEAVKRYMAGESVAVLAKRYKISKPGFYLWVQKYKQALLEQAERKDLKPKDAALVDKRVLIAEIQALKLENQKLRNKVVSLMVKHGEL